MKSSTRRTQSQNNPDPGQNGHDTTAEATLRHAEDMRLARRTFLTTLWGTSAQPRDTWGNLWQLLPPGSKPKGDTTWAQRVTTILATIDGYEQRGAASWGI